MEGSGVGSTKCPQCSADVAAGEKFCAACGAGIAVAEGIVRPQDAPPPEVIGLNFERDARIGRARKWLMAISIITLISGFAFYAIQSEQADKIIRESAQNLSSLDAAQRDAAVQAEVHMTWDQWVSHTRGQVTLFLFINIGLAAVYFGMFFWAKRNPLAASVTALLLFITVMGVNAVYDPKSLAQGVIVKIFFVGALAKAISAAQEERKLNAQVPRATIAS
jgi:hypothetical protein